MTVFVTIQHHFNAGHRLHNPRLSDEENRRLYGRCNNPSGHGHNYHLHLTLRGEVDPAIGAFVNGEAVREWLWNEVLEGIDHRNLNTDVECMRGVIPTSENLARAIFDQVEGGPYGQWLYEVKLYESDNNIATCRVGGLNGAGRDREL